MKTTIELKNMHFFAHHGVFSQEAVTGNEFVVNVKLEADLSTACESDEVADTINYADVFDLIKKEMQQSSRLLEHVAGRIYRKLKTTYPLLTTIEVSVAKQHPPVNGEMESAEIIIRDE